jgi:hypothetical protein
MDNITPADKSIPLGWWNGVEGVPRGEPPALNDTRLETGRTIRNTQGKEKLPLFCFSLMDRFCLGSCLRRFRRSLHWQRIH